MASSTAWAITRPTRFRLTASPSAISRAKYFSNQLPSDAVQSMEVIEGAPPAEYGDKTSLVIVVTTRSGLGQTTPHGERKRPMEVSEPRVAAPTSPTAARSGAISFR